jgi:hypothetical protein
LKRNPLDREGRMEVKSYRSPVQKLLRFFERSRDGWKRKCRNGKVTIKRLTNRVRKLEKSRDLWRQRSQEQQEKLRRSREEWEMEKNSG